ncbi:MAG TPA: UDP-N-acetylmuramate--L-alanine ligase [Thermomicrobiales bacterium]|nr:UDP-N-acetylmuramate--L-alanine ligase [Thermomicrobiales bacterium]
MKDLRDDDITAHLQPGESRANDLTSPRPCQLPEPPAAIHFVGIGGVGMSGLARILHAGGYRVSGSDATASDQTAALISEGIPVAIGHADVDLARAADLLVVTAAVRGDNPEVRAAERAEVPKLKRAALLGLLADRQQSIAVAGSHGKSTTSAMIVAALRALGADPTYAIGATLATTGINAASGSGDTMVVEADEYDYSFLSLHPNVAVITNIEFDHPDIFPDQDAYHAAFARFVANIPPEGTLVIAADDPGCERLLARSDFNHTSRLVTFGESGSPGWLLAGSEGNWHVTPPEGASVQLPISVPGRHNARNATAALAAIAARGFDPATIARALRSYAGIGRRFDRKGEANGVTVIDDYAHHPSEIRATIEAARARYPGGRIWAIFQPHTFSRTKALLPEFAESLSSADQTLVLDIYAARETDDLDISSADMARRVPGAHVVSTPDAAAERLAQEVVPNDIVLTLGAGDITKAGPLLLERLRSAAPTPRLREDTQGPTIPDHPDLKVLIESPMSLHTTWRVGGPADFLVRAPSPEALEATIAWGHSEGLPITMIGGGSNLLVGDGGIRGLVILARAPGQRAGTLVEAEDAGDHMVVSMAAQAPLSWAGRYAAERGWAGLDWGVGLPGTIGGATVNNAGAHGTELKDHLASVVVIDNAGSLTSHPASWLAASYRLTTIKAHPRPRPFHVVRSIFHLPKGDPALLVKLAEEHARFRKTTQPTGACAGSTFANPPGDFAGRLLEAAGLKGHRVGNAQFSPKHANWIINAGNAKASDVQALIAHARQVVLDRFGIELRQEIEEIGDFTPPS